MKFFLFLLFSLTLSAHQTGLSFLELIQLPHKEVAVTYKKPLSDTRVGDIEIFYPQGCVETSKLQTQIINGFIIKKSKLICTQKSLEGTRIWIKGMVYNDRGVLVRYENKDFVKKEILRNTTPFMKIEKEQSKAELMFEYIELGIFHILSGYDHLLFVLLLFLLTSNLKSLLYTISAFTLAHSITLSCGILGIVYMPPPLTESMIALSIIFLAKELMIFHVTFTKRHLAFVAFSFGLLHGFGFSSVLQDIGLPQNEIPLSLFSFNVGIELGQILFISVASLIVYLLKLVHIRVEHYYKFLAYMAGSLASFWFIQRVLTF